VAWKNSVRTLSGFPKDSRAFPRVSCSQEAGYASFGESCCCLGCVSGALLGLFFHDEKWLGGYASWRRRMLRLGHISFFGIGLLNLAYALTLNSLGLQAPPAASLLFLVAAVGMPAVCFLSAVRDEWRLLFFIPVLSVTAGSGIVMWRLISS
jgi:hypothetical protein